MEPDLGTSRFPPSQGWRRGGAFPIKFITAKRRPVPRVELEEWVGCEGPGKEERFQGGWQSVQKYFPVSPRTLSSRFRNFCGS